MSPAVQRVMDVYLAYREAVAHVERLAGELHDAPDVDRPRLEAAHTEARRVMDARATALVDLGGTLDRVTDAEAAAVIRGLFDAPLPPIGEG